MRQIIIITQTRDKIILGARQYGNVRVFRQLFKEVYRHYIMGVANLNNLDSINYNEVIAAFIKSFGMAGLINA